MFVNGPWQLDFCSPSISPSFVLLVAPNPRINFKTAIHQSKQNEGRAHYAVGTLTFLVGVLA